jgi:dienelactone hydrolase
LIVVLHEIYGINDHITKTCQDLADSGYDVVCPDLLDGKPFLTMLGKRTHTGTL